MVTEELMDNAINFVNKFKNEDRNDIINAVHNAISYWEDNPFVSIADE